ncbi:MAG: 2'-5' RNA ligase, partial [Sphingobacteriales bacterium]
DDRIQYDYWLCLQKMRTAIHTEKLDGENNCLNRYGVFARSHAAPTTSPWTSHLRPRWDVLKNDLGDLELFGENIYAIHSIEYRKIEHYFYVFAVRDQDRWLSWEEVCFYAAAFDMPTVPVLGQVADFEKEDIFRNEVLALTQQASGFESLDAATGKPCTLEGIVTRNADGFATEDLGLNVFKYVRKGHVKTDEHWTRNWKRARLIFERKNQ